LDLSSATKRKMSVSLFQITQEYISRMIPEDGSMKVLLLDEGTLQSVSMSFSQTELLKRGVFLVDRLDRRSTANGGNGERGAMPTMRCCVFVRPTPQNLSYIEQEIKAGRYCSYHVVFTNAITTDGLDLLARADSKCLVVSVEEYFCDITTTNSDLFTIPIHPHTIHPALVPSSHFQRVAEGLAATFVALRRKPHIRFLKSSPYARRVCQELVTIIKGDPELYNFKTRDTVLLITDRADDPITPLLTPWTYQAMLHELVGIHGNRLRLPEVQKEEDEHCFCEVDDSFFASNMMANWGDLCSNVKAFVDECKATMNIDRSTATMEEIKQFMQKLPQTKTMTSTVTKHATVVSHLSSVIKQRSLLDVSLLEQDMVSNSSCNEHWNRLVETCRRSDVHREDILRLCIIYNMRYEKFGAPSRTEELLQSAEERQLLGSIREYFGDRPVDTLFASSGVMSSIVKTFSDVGNIYTQHEPALKKILHALVTGKLDDNVYAYAPIQAAPPAPYRPKEVIVFSCGGTTYAEAALVRAVNKGTAFSTGSLTLPPTTANDFKVMLGGTEVLSSSDFLHQLRASIS